MCRNIRKLQYLTVCVQLFKYQVSAAIEALFKLNVNCETVFSCLDEKDVHLVGY